MHIANIVPPFTCLQVFHGCWRYEFVPTDEIVKKFYQNRQKLFVFSTTNHVRHN